MSTPGCIRVGQLAFLLLSLTVRAQGSFPIDLLQAREAFAEGERLSLADGGRLWGRPLYGPMCLVDPKTRYVVANEPDGKGLLHEEGGLYVGGPHEGSHVANAPAEWGGKRWAMLRWPLPADPPSRRVLLARELFRRLQPDLQLDVVEQPNDDLETPTGRLYLQLEWRALAGALITTGKEQDVRLHDALEFRAHRHEQFGSARAEASLEIEEGLAEYTGIALGAPDEASGRWRIIARLSTPEPGLSFGHDFASIAGPAYALLLDQRRPGWRARLTRLSDLGQMLGPFTEDYRIFERARAYGGQALRSAESIRACQAAPGLAASCVRLFTGPTLTLPGCWAGISSIPGNSRIALTDAETYLHTYRATADWGRLEVTDGGRVSKVGEPAWVWVAAPFDITGSHIAGPGWTLDLKPGWQVIPASFPRDFTVNFTISNPQWKRRPGACGD
jgi:hypothetical protein